MTLSSLIDLLSVLFYVNQIKWNRIKSKQISFQLSTDIDSQRHHKTAKTDANWSSGHCAWRRGPRGRRLCIMTSSTNLDVIRFLLYFLYFSLNCLFLIFFILAHCQKWQTDVRLFGQFNEAAADDDVFLICSASAVNHLLIRKYTLVEDCCCCCCCFFSSSTLCTSICGQSFW